MRLFLAAILALLLAGCAGYKLGPVTTDPAGSRSVQIRPFVNRTTEPRVTEYVSESLRKHIQKDGTFRLETQEAGDIIVSGEIIRFDRGALAFQPNDTLTPQDYYLTLTARITAIDRSTGKTIFSRPISGRTSIRVGSDQSSAERQAIPLLTDDLARNTVSVLADGPW